MILLKLILAHLAGDFLLQPASWIKEKERARIKSPKLYFHVLIHGILILLVLWNLAYWPVVLIIMLLHYAIDVLKLYWQKPGSKTAWFWADQILHIIVILIVYWIWFSPSWPFNSLTVNSDIWILVTALVFITAVAGVIIQKLMERWASEIKDSSEQSLHNAGKYIGILERLFIFAFIISSHWAPIGFLLASKSIFRFGDLKEAKDRKLTEYILIGTLLSFGIAIATGMISQRLIISI